MKAILRSAIVAAGMAAIAVASTTPASATPGGAFAFTGSTTLTCFGCGHRDNQKANLSVTGASLAPATFVAAPATADFSIDEEGGVLCLVTGSANGTVSGGGLNVTFNWTRVGAVAVILTAGSVDGAGVAAFVVTDPVGPPCGGQVTASFAGAVAGA